MSFSLHPQLAADTLEVGRLPLCTVLLMNDSRFPWLILVPRVEGLRELHELDAARQSRLLGESRQAVQALQACVDFDKINVAALGNVVEQFHWHVVARHRDDVVWPGPVWGYGKRKAYAIEEAQALLGALQKQLGI